MKNKELEEIKKAVREYLKHYDYLRQMNIKFEQQDILNIDNALAELRRLVKE